MPSLTFWNHLEPTPRARTSERGLAAEIRDPLWMLTRQWQLGEFFGEDAGSPASVMIESDRWPLQQWSAADGTRRPLEGTRSLEQQMLGEPCPTTDLLTRVELGQVFEHFLAQVLPRTSLEGPGRLFQQYRLTFKLVLSVVAEDDRTRDTDEFLELCAGRCPDGHLLWEALRSAPDVVTVSVGTGEGAAVQTAQRRFVEWVREVYGEPGIGDSPTWVPEALDHRGGLLTAPLAGEQVHFEVRPGLRGEIDTYSLDVTTTTVRVPERATHQCHVVPGHLRVRGMPNARFWDFENDEHDWGAIEAEPRDLARLVFLETALTQGNDWFLVPFALPVGTVCRIRSLRVRDVFGTVTDVPRAGTLATTPARRWRMFSHSSGDTEDPGWRTVLPESTRLMVAGPPTEEVRFLRDEVANLAWALERTHPDAFGQPVTARDALALRAADQPAPTNALAAMPREAEPRLSYELQSKVPRHWVPWVAVRVSPTEGDIALELARFGAGEAPLRTRILQPPLAGPYRVPEYVVPGSGLRVTRGHVRVREPDGRCHLWVRRYRGPGQGEGDSGLLYDSVKER